MTIRRSEAMPHMSCLGILHFRFPMSVWTGMINSRTTLAMFMLITLLSAHHLVDDHVWNEALTGHLVSASLSPYWILDRAILSTECHNDVCCRIARN